MTTSLWSSVMLNVYINFMLYSFQAPNLSCGGDPQVGSQIREQITALKQRVQETGADLDKCRQEQEAFSVEYYTFKERDVQLSNFVAANGENHPDAKKHKAAKESMEKAIRQKYLNLSAQRSSLVNGYVEIFQAVKEVQTKVLDKELIRWKREQQLAGNGYSMSFSLETLQEWCEGLADIIW